LVSQGARIAASKMVVKKNCRDFGENLRIVPWNVPTKIYFLIPSPQF
jgi:hypothetical protein